MAFPVIGTAIELASAYRNAPKRVNKLMTDEFGGKDEDGIEAARVALSQVNRGAQLYRKGRPGWRVTDGTNAQAGAERGGIEIEPTPDTLLKNVALLHTKRAVAMGALKRDLALATAFLTGLVATSLFFNKTKWGQELLGEMQKVKILDKAGDIIRQMTASKRATIFSVGSVVLGGLLANSAALRGSHEARRSAVAYNGHVRASQLVGIEVQAKEIEDQLWREGCPKAARHLHKMAG